MSYWFWGVIGFIAGSTLGVRNMVRNGCPFPVSVIMATAAVYGGLLGARSLYVLIYYPQMFQNDFIQAIAFWQSTGTWLGGPVAGILASWVVLKLAKVPFWSNAGSFVPGLVLAHIISRIGCLVNGCCYGAPTTVPWAIYSDRLQGTVHPTQIYSMLCELVVFIILQILWTKRESYRIYLFPLYGIMLPAHRFFTEFFRGCDTLPWIIPGLRTFQTISLFMFILFLSVLILMIWKKKGRVVVGFIAVTTIIAVSAANSDQIQHKYVKETPGQYIVVTRSVFENALEPWKKQKEKEGYSVVIHAWEKSPSAIVVKKQLEILTKKEIACIMVVGDSLKEPENNCTWDMPSIMRPSVLSTEKYAADSLFGDLDNDGLPDVPVGRLPVQTPEELNIQIDKIKKYSKQAKSNRYKGVVIWPLENNNIAFIKNIMPRGIPDVEILNNTEEKYRIFYNGNLKDIFLQRLGRMSAITTIIGHGSFRSIGPEENNKENFLCVDDLSQINTKIPSGLMFLLSCDSGKFNTEKSDGRSLAEAFMTSPGGPVAVVASSGRTTPVVSYIIGKIMLEQTKNMPKTAGELILTIQQKLIEFKEKPDPKIIKTVRRLSDNNQDNADKTAGTVGVETMMYNLLGDPSCRVVM